MVANTRRCGLPAEQSRFWGRFLPALLLASSAIAGDGVSSVWKVEGTGAAVYLAGTVHLLREEDHPLPGAFQEAYDRCQQVYFEVDLKEMDSPGFRLRMLEMSLLPEGEQLRDRVSVPSYEKLKSYLKKTGIDGSYFERMTPAMMAMTVTSLEATRLGARADLGVEMVFDRRAREDGKAVAGLETVDFQMKLFEQFTAKEQEELLRLTVENIGDMERDLPELLDAWRRGEAAKLDEVLNRHFKEHGRLAQVILYDRNQAWLPVVEESLKSKSGDTLFLVGVGHLVGEQGVIRLLEKRGYRVTQVGASS